MYWNSDLRQVGAFCRIGVRDFLHDGSACFSTVGFFTKVETLLWSLTKTFHSTICNLCPGKAWSLVKVEYTAGGGAWEQRLFAETWKNRLSGAKGGLEGAREAWIGGESVKNQERDILRTQWDMHFQKEMSSASWKWILFTNHSLRV